MLLLYRCQCDLKTAAAASPSADFPDELWTFKVFLATLCGICFWIGKQYHLEVKLIYLLCEPSVTYWQSSDSCDSEDQVTPTPFQRESGREPMGIQKIKHLKCWKCVICLFMKITVEWPIQALTLGISTPVSYSLHELNYFRKVYEWWCPYCEYWVFVIKLTPFRDNFWQYCRNHIDGWLFISWNGRKPINKSATSISLGILTHQ